MAGVLLRNFGKENEGIYEGLKKKYGDYLFGDKESGTKIGWYNEEKEIDTPAEKNLFSILKKYADSTSDVYSTISLDNLIPLSQISNSLKTFWLDHFNQLSLTEQQIIKLEYHDQIKLNQI